MSIAARSRYLERGKDLFCMATLYPIVSPIILNESNQARLAASTFRAFIRLLGQRCPPG